MNVSDAVQSGFKALVSYPSELLPFYLFWASTLMIARTVLYIGGALSLFVLTWRGRLAPVARELRELDLARMDFGAIDPAELQGLTDALAGLVTPTTVAIAVVSLCGFVVLLAVAHSIATAGALHAVHAALTGRHPLSAGVSGIARDALRFIGLLVVRVFLLALVSLPLGYVLVAASDPAGVLLAVAFGLLWVVALIVVPLALLFAEPAIVVDDAGVFAAIRRSAGFLRHQPEKAIAYVAVFVAVAIGTVILWVVFGILSIPQAATLPTVLVVVPYLDAVKMGLYASDAEPNEMRSARPVGRRFVGAFRRGWSELVAFTTSHPGLPVLALCVLLVGVAVGWVGVSGFGVSLPPPTNVGNTFGSVPVDTFVWIATNNWSVAASQTFAGLAFAVPTVTNLLFNGLLIGAVGGVFAPLPFLALVLPHGIIEIPALAIAGGMGLHLGRVTWGGLRGRLTTDEVAAEFGRAYDVLLGLVPLFVLAAFIETFVTPAVASLVLGG